jgi:hypothetical protein
MCMIHKINESWEFLTTWKDTKGEPLLFKKGDL